MTPLEALQAVSDQFTANRRYSISPFPRGVDQALDGEATGFVIQTGAGLMDGEDTTTTYTVSSRVLLFVDAQVDPEDAAFAVSEMTDLDGDDSIFKMLHDRTLGGRVFGLSWDYAVNTEFSVDEMMYAVSFDVDIRIERNNDV